MSRVLLIEPDVALAKTYETVLEHAGHSVVRCRGAQNGIFCVDENRPDIIVLELQLVGHSGIEFLYELRSYTEWRVIPVIIVTHVPPQEFAACTGLMREGLGVAEYHYKPQSSLRALLRSITEHALPIPTAA